MTNRDRPTPTCAFVGDQSLVVRCVDIAREAGLEVSTVASHNPDVLEAVAADGTELIELGAPSDLAPALASKKFDVLFSVAYLHIVPRDVLERATIAINFHDGPLPEYAGLNVTSWAIANGESTHGVTWHLMTSNVDSGDIITSLTFPIEPDDTALSLNARCFEAGAQTFVDVAQAIIVGDLPRRSQPSHLGRMYRRRERPVVVVDPQRPAAETARSIRAIQIGDRVVNTVGAAHLIMANASLIVADADVAEGAGRETGSVVTDPSGEIRVATIDGELVLRDVRRPDGRPAQPTGTQVSPSTGLARSLIEHDPVLSDHENWWRQQLRAPVDVPSLDELDPSLPVSSASIAVAAAPATVASAMAIMLAGRADGDTISLSVTDSGTAKLLSALSPLLSAPEIRVEVDLDRPASAHIADVEAHLEQALKHGAYLTDVINRDPALRGQTIAPVAQLRIGGATAVVADDPAALIVGVDDNRIEVSGHGSNDAIEGLAGRLADVIDALQSHPDDMLRSIDLLTDHDRGALDSLNETAVDVATSTIDAQFRNRVAESTDRPAVSCAGTTVSYAELSDRVDELSARLRAAGVEPADVVGIALERSVDLVTSVLAVLSVGAAYLPLDPEYPAGRLQFMVENSSTSIVIGRPDIVAHFDRDLVVIDPSDRLANVSTVPHDHSADELAYVIYTSGSTGTPKGVQVEHRQVANFFAGMDTVVGDQDPGVWLAVTSLSFDISVLELLWTLTRGFHVVVKQDSGFQPVRSFGGSAPTMSLFHFAAGGAQASDGYRLLLESSRWGDAHGFEAVWTPERHFHDFGAPYPNPSVVSAAVAAVTERIQIRAGSVVLPLHSPVRVAEEWSVVDNLSNGRVGISFAAGWQPNDFVLNPAGYANAREELADRIEAVRSLWRGETVDLPGPDGELVPVRTLPRPVQAELPVWLTSAGSPASFERAGTIGVNLLTHLLGQSIEQLTENIERYRAAYIAAGHEGDGKVTLMLHTFLDEDGDAARETAREPLTQYLGTAVGLIKNMASAFPTFAGAGKDADEAFRSLTDADIRQLLEMAADRYLSTSGLFGTVDDALDMVAAATRAGVDEVACLIDFGIDADLVLASLELLGEVHDRLDHDEGEIETVASLVERYDVSHLQCTPSLASMLTADPAERVALGRLDHMMVGGEALPTELARELTGVVPGRVTNMYGPTETTIWSLTHELDREISGSIPIGTPIANTTVHVLDRHHRIVPVGVFGELHLGGDGVARGYLDRPELNAERFVELNGVGRVYATGDIARVRPDGVVEFAGRSDGQVKIRGHRIELGEIEAVLDQHESVARSVVVARGPGEPTLVAFIVPAPDRQPDLELLRKHVAGNLPAAMVPTHFDTIDALPLTPNGKIDRKRLPEIGRSTTDAGAGAGEVSEGTEATVAAEWTRQLGRDVGRSDNFFDIGGHSLLAVNVFRNLADTTGTPISLTDVFRYPTVQQFAAHLDRLLADAGSEPTERQPDSGSDRGAKRRRALARRGGGDSA